MIDEIRARERLMTNPSKKPTLWATLLKLKQYQKPLKLANKLSCQQSIYKRIVQTHTWQMRKLNHRLTTFPQKKKKSQIHTLDLS